MSESRADLKQSVRDWLIKSGYPLELFSYERVVEAGYLCKKSVLYTDIEFRAERELDIFGEKTYSSSERHYFTIELLVECKKSEKPIVVLASGPKQATVRSEIYGARVYPSEFGNATVLAEIARERGIYSNDSDPSLPLSRLVRPGYSLVQAFKNSDELLYKALYGLAKAEHYFENQHESLFRSCVVADKHRTLPISLQIALLVVDGPLFTAFLNSGGLTVEETNWASVTIDLPWIERPSSERRGNIQVVAKEQLATFLTELDSFAEWLADAPVIAKLADELPDHIFC